MPSVLPAWKQQNIIKRRVCRVEIADSQKRAVALPENDIPCLHLRLVSQEDYSDFICCWEIATSPVSTRSHPEPDLSLFRIWMLTEDFMSMHKDVGILVVLGDYSLQDVHGITAKVAVVSHTVVQCSVRLVDIELCI
jgi:hypothetical protein